MIYMKDIPLPKIFFIACTIVGLGLLGAHEVISRDTMGFFLMFFMVCMVLLRWRIPKAKFTSMIDVVLCVFFAPMFVGIALFAAMYSGMYVMMIAAVYVLIAIDIQLGVIAVLCGGLGLLLRFWEKERESRLKSRDEEAGRYYELESLQAELLTATAQVERMSAVSERARISREIHDNAGHEIVAAFISLQTVRSLFDAIAISDSNRLDRDEKCPASGTFSATGKPNLNRNCYVDPEILSLYDAALGRLDTGVNKIREAVHNLSTVTTLGVESLQEICERFPKNIKFKVFGDMRHVPVFIWNVLESCLNEGLTNIGKHANPRNITVEVDVTSQIVRLCIENDGVSNTGPNKKGIGTGLRNLRHRLMATGGSLVVGRGETFRLVCVVPIKIASI